MPKYIILLVATVALVACKQKPAQTSLADSVHVTDTAIKPITPQRLISPGKGIGEAMLNHDADSLAAKLGKPDFTDAAMGALSMTWYAHHDSSGYQTNIYAHRNMGMQDENIAHIKLIRVTSPWYKTNDYSGPGSDFKDIQKLFKLKKSAIPGDSRSGSALYDDVNAGIAFEVESNEKCTAVLVHTKGDSVARMINLRSR